MQSVLCSVYLVALVLVLHQVMIACPHLECRITAMSNFIHGCVSELIRLLIAKMINDISTLKCGRVLYL